MASFQNIGIYTYLQVQLYNTLDAAKSFEKNWFPDSKN